MCMRMFAAALAGIVLCGCSGKPTATTELPPPSATQPSRAQAETAQSAPPASDATEATEAPAEETGAGSFYTVNRYDPDADPAADLAKTVALASAQGKRIILEVGGKW